MATIRRNKGDKHGLEGSYGMLSWPKYKFVYKSNYEIQVDGSYGVLSINIIPEFGIEPYPSTDT